jgi:16S rRNA processing protein RimM
MERRDAQRRDAQRLVVGRVRGVHGLRGAVRVEPLSDDPGRFAVGARFRLEGDDRTLTIAWAQPDGPGFLMRFHEVTDRDGADHLRDAYLEVEAERDLEPGRFYWHEVIGAVAWTTTGESLGTVDDVFRAGETEVYVVRGGARGEILVPAVRGIVIDLDPSGAGLVLDGGALDLPPHREKRPRGRRSSKPASPEPTAPAAVPEGSPDPGSA